MPRQRRRDARFDARGGVNSTYSEELLDTREVRRAFNARLTTHGAFLGCTGSRRLHFTPLAGPIRGLFQWDAPAGRQLVAIAGGHLYHKLEAAAEFTQVASTFAQGVPIRFETHRIGAVIVLYIADGVTLRKWDGDTLTTVAGAPAAADLGVYKGRLYAHARTKALYASAVSEPSIFQTPSGGFAADLETFDTEPIVGILPVGSSLLLAKEDNVARLTGVDPREIRLDSETEGISAEVGLAALATLVGLEGAAFGLSDRGPWLATESTLDLSIGEKVAAEFLAANRELLPLAVAVHHRGRKEIWVAFPGAGATTNDTLWIYAYETRAWSGPWIDRPAASLAQLELADGTESIVSGGYDGYVRLEDTPGSALLDVLADGSGGAPAVLVVDYGAALGDPSQVKRLVGVQSLQADLGASGVAEVAYESEAGSGVCTLQSKGAGLRSYGFKMKAKGRRLRIIVRAASATPPQLAGLLLTAAIGGRTDHYAEGVGVDARLAGGTGLDASISVVTSILLTPSSFTLRAP